VGKPETVVGGLDDLESLRALTRTRGRAGKLGELLGVQAGEVVLGQDDAVAKRRVTASSDSGRSSEK